MNPDRFGPLRKMVVEDKVSGTGLIEAVKRKAISDYIHPRSRRCAVGRPRPRRAAESEMHTIGDEQTQLIALFDDGSGDKECKNSFSRVARAHGHIREYLGHDHLAATTE